MLIEIKNKNTGNIIFSHDCEKNSIKKTVEPAVKNGVSLRDADLRDADLRGANLRGANLRGANLRGANLRDADLRDADLRGAYLRGADLRGAKLRGADLRDADLRYADLRDADLRGADLRGANLDFSCLPLWCGSFDLKCDSRLLYQLLYHVCRLDCESDDFAEIRMLIAPYVNKFHRSDECGVIE